MTSFLKVTTMIYDLKLAMERLINESIWMDDITKAAAIEKVKWIFKQYVEM